MKISNLKYVPVVLVLTVVNFFFKIELEVFARDFKTKEKTILIFSNKKKENKEIKKPNKEFEG